MEFSVKGFFSKYDQIRSFLKKSLMESFIFLRSGAIKFLSYRFFICEKIISSSLNCHIVLQIFESTNTCFFFAFSCEVGFVECISKKIILSS